MTPEDIIIHCLAKPGAYLDYPFGADTTIIKVEQKIFAQIFVLKGQDQITLNCDKIIGQCYRDQFPDSVVRGYHCPPIQQPYFNTMPLDGSVPDHMLYEMMEHSYDYVISKLPQYKQKRLKNL